MTKPRIYKTVAPTDMVFAQLRALQSLANVAFIAEAVEHLMHLESLALAAKAHGGAVRDARIAAICLSHGEAANPACWT